VKRDPHASRFTQSPFTLLIRAQYSTLRRFGQKPDRTIGGLTQEREWCIIGDGEGDQEQGGGLVREAQVNERVLVVDDDPLVVDLFVNVLEDAGYRVEGVFCGKEAIERLTAAPFDVLLADVKMPDVDGLEVLRQAKALDPEIAAVIITGYGTMEMAIKAIQLGAEGFVLKPAEVEDLLAMVAHAVEKRQLIRENVRLKALLPLFEVTKRLASEVEPGELNELALDFAVKETKADGGAVLLRDETRPGCLTVAAVHGMHPEIARAITIQEAEDPIGRVLQSGAGCLLVADEGPLGAVADWAGAAWELCVPLSIGKRVLGVLDVWGTQRQALTEDYLLLLSTLAGQLAVARENALLYQHMESMVDAPIHVLLVPEAGGRRREGEKTPTYPGTGDRGLGQDHHRPDGFLQSA